LTAVCGEIEQIPPFVLSAWRQRRLDGCLATNEIAAHRDRGLDALGPEKSEKVRISPTPVKSPHDRFIDFECIHEADGIGCDRGRLSVARRRGGEEPRFALASQIWHENTVASRCEYRSDIDEAVNIVRPAVEKKHRGAIRRSGFRIGDAEYAGVDVL